MEESVMCVRPLQFCYHASDAALFRGKQSRWPEGKYLRDPRGSYN